MKRYLDNINRKISKLIKEISEEEQIELNKITDENEKRKIKYITLYYKTVLNGCGFFSSDVSKCVSSINDMDDEEAMLKYYEKDNYNEAGDIELEENPPINMEVTEVYADEDIVLEENPILNMEVAEVRVEEEKGCHILESLFLYFMEHPEEIPESIPAGPVKVRVKDYVAGMTDKFASETYKDLFIPKGFHF